MSTVAKTCPACGCSKPLTDFTKSRNRPHGVGSYCKECHNARGREQRKTEAAKEWRREWRKRPEQMEQRRAYERDYIKTPARRRYLKKQKAVYRSNNADKEFARNVIYRMLRNGTLVRPDACSECGVSPLNEADGRSGLHAHHDDYSKAREIRWLCRPCHTDYHRREEARS